MTLHLSDKASDGNTSNRLIEEREEERKPSNDGEIKSYNIKTNRKVERKGDCSYERRFSGTPVSSASPLRPPTHSVSFNRHPCLLGVSVCLCVCLSSACAPVAHWALIK